MKNFIYSIVLFITFVFTPTFSWGGVDGKGIFCKGDFELFDDEKYLFKNNKVIRYELSVTNNDKYEIKVTPYEGNYGVSHSSIFWSYGPFNVSLNRKTLTLIRYIGDSETKRSCVVYSEMDFLEKVNEEKERLQSEYDEKTNDNKI